MTLHITLHAIERAMERCGCQTEAAAREFLATPAVHTAAGFGAPYVKLHTGHRIVIEGDTVVTVLPEWTQPWHLGR